MKKKLGFTLAEVLITLAIIGIIAALVLPALLNNFQFRAVGTRLSKFMSTVENNARAYVESTDSLSSGANGNAYNLDRYINSAFSISEITRNAVADANARRNIYSIPAGDRGMDINGFMRRLLGTAVGGGDNGAPIALKDGTRVEFVGLNVDDDVWPDGAPVPDQGQIGLPVMGVIFDPAANALPASVRRIFGFVVTELGYVYPAPTDGCTWSLYINRWRTTPDDFAAGTACGDDDQPGDMPAWQLAGQQQDPDPDPDPNP